MTNVSARKRIALLLVFALFCLLLCSCGIGPIDDAYVEKMLKSEGYTQYEKRFGDWVDYTSSSQHVEFVYYASKSESSQVDLVTIKFYPKSRGDGFNKPEWEIHSTGSTWSQLN